MPADGSRVLEGRALHATPSHPFLLRRDPEPVVCDGSVRPGNPAVPAHAVRLQGGADDRDVHLQEARRTEAPQGRRAEHPDHPDGRRRAGHALDVWRRDQYADARPGGEAGGLASTASIPPPCARPRGRRCSPGATTRLSAMARSRRSPTTSTAFPGSFPKSSATVAEVLKNYGYNTGAWGKWHNTPEEQITSKGPFDYWPTGYGFEYFYGFLAGEASQYEPTLDAQHHRRDPCTPRRATTSPRTSRRTRSSGCASRKPTRRTSRSSCTGHRALRMGRTRS